MPDEEETKSEGYHTTGSGNLPSPKKTVVATVMYAAGSAQTKSSRRPTKKTDQERRASRGPSSRRHRSSSRDRHRSRSRASRRHSRYASSESRSRSRSPSTEPDFLPRQKPSTKYAVSPPRRQDADAKPRSTSRRPVERSSRSGTSPSRAEAPALSKRARQRRAKAKTKGDATSETSSGAPSPAIAARVTSDVEAEVKRASVADQLKRAREAGSRSMTLGPVGASFGMSPVERQVLEASVSRWKSSKEGRIYPEASYSFAASVSKDSAFQSKCEEVIGMFSETWLRKFGVVRTADPAPGNELAGVIPLDGLTAVEQASLLQTVLYAAGYSFYNLVPALHRRESPLGEVSPVAMQTRIFGAGWVLGELVARHNEIRSRSPTTPAVRQPAPVDVPVAAPVVDPTAMRKPESVISSSDWSYKLPRSAGSQSPAVDSDPDEAMPTSTALPTLERDPFFRQRGLGPVAPDPTSSPAAQVSYVQQQSRVVSTARPPAFDEPMRAAPALSRFFESAYPAAALQPAGPVSAYVQPSVPHSSAGFTRPESYPPGVAAPPVPMPLREATPAFVSVPVAAPAREPAPNVSPPVQQVIYDQRPFIPLRYLDSFYGDESLSERKIWWEEYLYIAAAGGWTSSDKCRYLKMYLKKSALAWYKQLGDGRTQWSALKEAFRDEFLTPTKPAYETYCCLSQGREESARQYLWRLNAAARDANISLSTATQLERHVDRFVRSLKDQTDKLMLLGESFSSMKALEKKLRLYESRSHPTRGDDDGREPTSSKDRDRRDRSSSRSRSTYWTYRSDDSDSEYRDSRARDEGRRVRFEDDEDESDSDEETGSAYLAARQQQYGSRPPSPRRQFGSGAGPTGTPAQSHGKESGVASQPAPAAATPSSGPRKGQCYECGEHDHWANVCPTRTQKEPHPTCEICGGAHPKEFCWKKCPACQQMHKQPEDCPNNKFLADMKTWFQGQGASGLASLPAHLAKHLN